MSKNYENFTTDISQRSVEEIKFTRSIIRILYDADKINEKTYRHIMSYIDNLLKRKGGKKA